MFIHDALNEYIMCGETDIAAGQLKMKVKALKKIAPGKSVSGFTEKFGVGASM